MADTRIASVRGRRVWDSRGRPTVEVEVALVCGATGRAIAPAGASTGTAEVVELRDHGPAFGGHGVERAVAAVNGEIAAALKGQESSTFTKTVYGSSALIASWTRGSAAWPRSSKKNT